MPSVRDAFFNRIYQKIHSGEDIYIITPDLGAPSLDNLRKYHPDRFISVGIAEQSLITIAAGLIQSGHKVVAYGLNPFPVTRAFDQVRCVMSELNIPLTLCGLNAGICSADAGYTHMATEVFGMMRMLPNIRINNPSDETMAECLADAAVSDPRSRFIFFDKAISGKRHAPSEIDFEKGYFAYHPLPNAKIALIANGCYSTICSEIVDTYALRGVALTLIEPYSIPVDTERLTKDLSGISHILTVEENMLPGGLGAYVLEILSDHQMNIPVTRMGLRMENGVPRVFMNRTYLRDQQKLNPGDIVASIDRIIEGLV